MLQQPVRGRVLILPLALMALTPFIAAAASRTPLQESLLWAAAGVIALLVVPAIGPRLAAGGKTYIPAVCSAVMPGLGQVVNGNPGKGFLVCVLCAFGLKEVSAIGGLIAAGAWLCGIADALVTAHRMSTGSVPLLPVPRAIFIEYVVLGLAAVYALP
ncbi:hypothetical protein [Methanofollis ethanolicus]|uniref:hypothetical protein n=1 Tax=Methanofollis ethanolicus TaxID=488124 RepID=UPI00082EE8B8|nr:hypothetical protein [Methanofollis ethanolicus]